MSYYLLLGENCLLFLNLTNYTLPIFSQNASVSQNYPNLLRSRLFGYAMRKNKFRFQFYFYNN